MNVKIERKPMATRTRKVKSITINYRTELVKADPNHNIEANNPVEYQFSKNRKFRGRYKERGAYAPAA